MESKLISIVSPNTINNTTVSISSEDENFFIIQKSKNIRKIDYNRDSIQKPVYLFELFRKLKNYRWFIEKTLYLNLKQSSTNPDIYITADNKNISFDTQIYSLNCSNISGGNSLITEINDEYDSKFYEYLNNSFKEDLKIEDDINNMKGKNEIYLLNNSKRSIDFLNTQNICSLIEYDSDLYTNSVNIKKLLSKKPIDINTSIKIDLSIQYTKKDDEGIYTFDTTFNGFSTVENCIDFNNSIVTIGDIRVEYLGGVIQVFPLSNKITECIISNCLITYGKL